MSSSNLDIKALITAAWEKTLRQTEEAQTPDGKSEGRIHSDRSEAWVNCLGKGFREHYQDEDQRVFWKQNESNTEQFGLNELLFDVLVCQVNEVKSVRRGTRLQFISKCYWQVESELNDSNSREITKDFSKLIMGNSDNKLFISAYGEEHRKQVLEMCSEMAGHCTGNLYMCFIGHPRKWRNFPGDPVVFRWEDSEWKEL